MIFLENKKKNFILFFCAILFVASGIFFMELSPAFAQEYKPIMDFSKQANGAPTMTVNNSSSSGSSWGIGSIVEYAVKSILYAIFIVFGWLVSVAITIFEFAVKPENVSGSSGVLNLQAVYEMWQFIRDFFNLFFILVLLYIAFTTVFQIQKNFKQMILSLIIAALLVNFSFPISRFIIDATNVPMYFFANQMMASTNTKTTSDALGSTLSASRLKNILIPNKLKDTSTSRLFMAVIFMFMFAITLLVLAVMFVIRLIALMFLVIFSAAGFAAAIIPGMEKYSKMWWDNFWKYALFGPAAMLMLLISVGFFVVIGNEKDGIFKSVENVAGNIASDPTYLASLVMFSVPIILLWFAIGLGQTMAIAGGATISGYGHKFATWAGKKASGYSTIKRNFDSYVATRKKRTDEKNKNNWGGNLGDRLNRRQDTIHGATGLPGSEAARRRVQGMRSKKVAEEEKRMEDTHTNKAELQDIVNPVNRSRHNTEEIEAAVRLLSKKDDIQSGGEMNDAIAAMDYANAGDPRAQAAKRNELIRKAGGEIYQNGAELATAVGHLGTDIKAISQLISKASDSTLDGAGPNGFNAARYGAIIAAAPTVQRSLDSRLTKAGQANTLVDYQSRPGTGVTRDVAVMNVLNNIRSAKEKVNQTSLFTAAANRLGIQGHLMTMGPQVRQELDRAAAQESSAVHGVLATM